MDRAFDIGISGNGPVGKSLALALARAGMRVALIGKPPSPSHTAKRVLAITARPWQWLSDLCDHTKLTQSSHNVSAIAVQIQHTKLRFTGADRDAPDTDLCHIIEQDTLDQILNTQIAQCDTIECIAGELSGFETDDLYISCIVAHTQNTLKARLLIGCDGRDSPIREWSGIAYKGYRYRAHALNCVIEQVSPAPHTAAQIFAPDGPLALLPMASGQTGLVFSVPPALAEALSQLDAENFIAQLRARSDDFTGAFRLVSPCRHFPIASQIASRFHAPRLALAGDAAHRIHPLAGQGLNMGLADAAILAAILGQSRRCGLDLGAKAALTRYENIRRPYILAMLDATERLTQIANPSSSTHHAARFGLQILERTHWLRRIITDMACHESPFNVVYHMDNAA